MAVLHDSFIGSDVSWRAPCVVAERPRVGSLHCTRGLSVVLPGAGESRAANLLMMML